MSVYKIEQYLTNPESSRIYGLDIRILSSGKINVKFTTNDPFTHSIAGKLLDLKPGRTHVFSGIGDGPSTFGTVETIFDNHAIFISVINHLKESSMINPEFADHICQQLPNLIAEAATLEQQGVESRVALGGHVFLPAPTASRGEQFFDYNPDAPFCNIPSGPSL